jgi:hypothetical protein
MRERKVEAAGIEPAQGFFAGTEVVEVSLTDEFDKTIAQVTKNLEASGTSA